jgi:transposase InsO family protein
VTAAEKMEVIRLVEGSSLSVKRTLAELAIPRSTFYRWYRDYARSGYAGLEPGDRGDRRHWNRIPDQERQRVVEIALEKPEFSPRELAWHITDTQGWFVSESSVYRILKQFDLVASPAYIVVSAAKTFSQPTRRVHELWQTDFTWLKVAGWGYYYLTSILDDYSRYIIAWMLSTTMTSEDVKALIDRAMMITGVNHPRVHCRPRLLSDNGSAYISKDLQEYLAKHDIAHVRGRPYHPQTQGKIERWHRTMKNVVTLETHFFPWEMEMGIGRFVDYYCNDRVHESLDNLTPADVYHGRAREILTTRELVKLETHQRRRLQNLGMSVKNECRIKPAELRKSIL